MKTDPRALAVGRRIYLRHPEFEDWEEFAELVRASRSLHRPWVYPTAREARFSTYVVCSNLAENQGHFVCLREGGALAGVVNLNAILRGTLRGAYLGFFAHADHAGCGYMTEALHLALARGFRVLKLHRIEANVQPTNRRSIAVIERCGFRREGFSPGYLKIGGRWKDHERWAILANEWKAPFKLRQLR